MLEHHWDTKYPQNTKLCRSSALRESTDNLKKITIWRKRDSVSMILLCPTSPYDSVYPLGPVHLGVDLSTNLSFSLSFSLARYSALLLLVIFTLKDTSHQSWPGRFIGRVFSLRSFLSQLSPEVVSWCFMNRAEWGFLQGECWLSVKPRQ